MCGIVGLFAPGVADPLDVARRMAAVIAHRGADDEGFLQDGAFAMGMRRLSIIDLAGGHQPMTDETGNLYARRYFTALQEHPEAVLAHRGVVDTLRSWTAHRDTRPH